MEDFRPAMNVKGSPQISCSPSHPADWRRGTQARYARPPQEHIMSITIAKKRSPRRRKHPPASHTQTNKHKQKLYKTWHETKHQNMEHTCGPLIDGHASPTVTINLTSTLHCCKCPHPELTPIALLSKCILPLILELEERNSK